MADVHGYFLTWTTYGTWLPGDERGWYDKHDRRSTPKPEDSTRKGFASANRVEPPFALEEPQARQVVEKAVEEACLFRKWFLHTVRAQSNHVHVVVTAPGVAPESVENTFKGRATYRLKQLYACANRKHWWTQRGSRRRLFGEASLARAIKYVQEQDIAWMKHPRKTIRKEMRPRNDNNHNNNGHNHNPG